jgi:heterodisulfide reductase subunit E
LLVVVITGFYAQTLRGDVARNLIEQYPPGLFNNITVMFHEVFTLLFCVAYLPFSKYFHMITAPLTILVNHGGE